MKSIKPIAVILLIFVSASGRADVKASRDHPMVSRYAGSEIISYQTSEFDEFGLITSKVKNYGGLSKNRDSTIGLEGRVTRIRYKLPEGVSTIVAYRNFEQALLGAGFESIYSCTNVDCGGRNFNHAVVPYMGGFSENYEDQRYLAAKLARNRGDVFVAIYVVRNYSEGGANRNRIFAQVDVVEKVAMKTDMVTVDANAMEQAITEQGRIALYGIYFDTGKANIKSASQPTIGEIAKLLTQQPKLALIVVGHTDSQGSLQYNLGLSKQRAQAVKQALVDQHGIAASRLWAYGVGYLVPVASNRQEEGRVQNRRVELVER
jgi:outer membrane protein OmpA-like peptidoglycan-associated protein